MTDLLDEIERHHADGFVLQDDMDWLIGEVKRLRQRLREEEIRGLHAWCVKREMALQRRLERFQAIARASES